jgi:hypothetical protein
MNATYSHTLAGLFALTAILALLALAGNGEARADALPDSQGEPVSSAEHAADAAQHRAQRRAVRAQLSMPYFSYSRALPRTAEI